MRVYSIMCTGIRANFTGKQAGSVALTALIDIILLFISPLLAGGKTNLFSKVKSSLIFSTLGSVLCFDVIALTMNSSYFGSEGYPNDDGLLPEEISAILM